MYIQYAQYHSPTHYPANMTVEQVFADACEAIVRKILEKYSNMKRWDIPGENNILTISLAASIMCNSEALQVLFVAF